MHTLYLSFVQTYRMLSCIFVFVCSQLVSLIFRIITIDFGLDLISHVRLTLFFSLFSHQQHRHNDYRKSSHNRNTHQNRTTKRLCHSKFSGCHLEVGIDSFVSIHFIHFRFFSVTFTFFREEFQGLLTYYVPPRNDLKWSRMFGLMEVAKKASYVEDYSISQTSLEEVFLSFAENQTEDLRIA